MSYLTRQEPPSLPPVASIEERESFASGSLPNKEQQQRIKQMYSDSLPKGTNFDFKKYPLTGVSLQGNEKLYKNISNNLYRPGYILSGEKQNVIKSQQRKEKLKEYLKNEFNKFENKKILPNEKYKINKEQLRKDFKVDHPIINNVLNDLKKEGKYNFITPKLGESTATSLPQEIIDSYKKNYNKKTVAQIASEITGKPYNNKETKNMYGQLNRLQKTLIGDNLINPKDVAVGSVGEPITNTKSAYDKYTQAQQRLMKLDPKTYKEFKSPASLDRELKKRLRFNEISGALDLDFPKGLKPSYEHIQGITPSHIIQDPEGLRKVGIQTRRYNFNIMGRETMNSPYKIVQNYLSTARRSLDLNDIETAKNALNEVNTIYDEVSDSYKGIKRKELPFYNIKNDRVVESNVKGVIKPQTLQKGFEQYFKNTAAVVKPEELNQLKNIQPNVANILTLYKKGEDIKASNLIKTRIPDIKKGELFMNVIPGQQSMIDFVQGIGSDVKAGKILAPFLKVLAPVGTVIGAYDVAESYKEGKPLTETATSFLGLDPIVETIREESRLSPESKDIRKKIRTEERLADPSFVSGLDVAPSIVDYTPANAVEKARLALEQDKIQRQLKEENVLRKQEREKALDYITNRFSPFANEAVEMKKGGRIGFADGSDEIQIPTLNKKPTSSIYGKYASQIANGKVIERGPKQKGKLGPEDPLSKYKSYSEEELAGNIEAKKPNFDTLEDYILQTMPIFEPKDVAPPKSYSPMPVEEYLRKRYQIDLAEGGPSDPSKRKFIKGAGIVGAVGLGIKYIPDIFQQAKKLKIIPKKAPLVNIVRPFGATETNFPEWFPTLVSRLRKEGNMKPIYATEEVPLTKEQYLKLFIGDGEKNTSKVYDRYTGFTENYVNELKQKGIPQYYQVKNKDEIIGYEYTDKNLPDLKAVEYDGQEMNVYFKNNYGQSVEMQYVSPGKKTKEGQFSVADARPEPGSGYDSAPDFEQVYVKDIDEVLGGSDKVEQYATKAKTPRYTKGAKEFDDAEGRALTEIDRLKDEGLIDD
jgi:hypothetical protein